MSEQERKAVIYSRKCELRQERRTRRQLRRMERLVRCSILSIVVMLPVLLNLV